jgi:hypothetical protein
MLAEAEVVFHAGRVGGDARDLWFIFMVFVNVEMQCSILMQIISLLRPGLNFSKQTLKHIEQPVYVSVRADAAETKSTDFWSAAQS